MALLALLITAAAAVYIGLETRCQRQLNAIATDESAATAALVDAIFVSDELEEQMSAYADYLSALDDITKRRATLGCSG